MVRDRSRHKGQALLVRTPAGVGKSTAVGEALKRYGGNARVLVGTKRLAEELAREHHYKLISGRSPENCERFDVVRTLADRGFSIEANACGTAGQPRCPFRGECGYYRQFHAIGSWIGSAEQLYNRNFLQFGDIVVLDDADLMRTTFTEHAVSQGQLHDAAEQLKASPAVQALVRVIRHATIDAPSSPVGGAAAWDVLAAASNAYGLDLPSLIEALPATRLLPAPDASELITVESVEAVPPAHLTRVLHTLQEELSAFVSNEDFNSRLRIGQSGIEVRLLREHVRDSEQRAVVANVPLLVLDATPVEAVVGHVLREHVRLPDVEATVSLPANVTVIQYAGRTNGHRMLSEGARLEAVLEEVRREREHFPVSSPDLEAVVCFKSHRQRFVDIGFADSQVLSYGSARGTNVLAGVERLHVIGRPMPPGEEVIYAAQVLHHDEASISPEVVLRTALFGGQRLAVDVVDYADERLSRLLHAYREDELIQVVHRARLLTLDPQLGMLGSAGRDAVRLVLHTSHPVPGLPVHELVCPVDDSSINLNQERAAEAEQRILDALMALQEEGSAISVDAVARRAGANWKTTSRVLGNALHTPKGSAPSLQANGDADTKSPPTGLRGSGTALHTPKDEPEQSPSVSTLPHRQSGQAGNALHTPKRTSSRGVQSCPKPEPLQGEPCRCAGCSACDSGLDLHHEARLLGDWWQSVGVCRWCQLQNGTAA